MRSEYGLGNQLSTAQAVEWFSHGANEFGAMVGERMAPVTLYFSRSPCGLAQGCGKQNALSLGGTCFVRCDHNTPHPDLRAKIPFVQTVSINEEFMELVCRARVALMSSRL